MFKLIAEAESKIHGINLEDVHFHEVGAADSIVDIVGVCTCFKMLSPCKVYFSELPVGAGTINSGHGPLPLPAPAAIDILRGSPVYGINEKKELITPTGAAIVKTFAEGFGEFPSIDLEKTGTGLSKNNFDSLPGLLRIFKGKLKESKDYDSVTVIETNIDDFDSEFYGHVQELLFSKGALDVTLAPIIMKKGRPGHTLSVICEIKDRESLTDSILAETSTTGLRYYEASRRKLKREIINAQTVHGLVKVKKIETANGPRFHPEYEDIRKIALEKSLPLQTIYNDVIASLKHRS
jgi:hypothetical protein